MRYELPTDHPDELQVWGVRRYPPVGYGFWTWAKYIFGLAVRVFTLRWGGKYSHLLLRKGNSIWEAVEGGVVAGAVGDYSDPTLIVDAYHVNATAEQELAAEQYAEDHIGTPYDFLVNLKIALHLVGLNDDGIPDDLDVTLNCSGLVAHAYARGHVDLAGNAGVPMWLYAPTHIYTNNTRGLAEFRGRVVFSDRGK